MAVAVSGLVGCRAGDGRDYSVAGCMAMLKDADPQVRYAAVSNLGKYGTQAKEAVPALTDALKDSDTKVRIGAAYALAKIGPDAKAAVPALTNALKDKERKVREGAAYALKQISGKK